jgi:hypothetical protein
MQGKWKFPAAVAGFKDSNTIFEKNINRSYAQHVSQALGLVKYP